MKDFRELEVWKEGRKFRNVVLAISKKFPSEEKYKLTDQIIRSSRSINANIAEGYGRYHFQENIQFCRQARGSLTETLDHLVTALVCEYVLEKQFNELEEQYDLILKLLNGYISYLKKRKNEE